MKAHFDTREFVQSHGHQPRGRGDWSFEAADGSLEVLEIGTFTAARASVARAYPEVDVWLVLP